MGQTIDVLSAFLRRHEPISSPYRGRIGIQPPINQEAHWRGVEWSWFGVRACYLRIGSDFLTSDHSFQKIFQEFFIGAFYCWTPLGDERLIPS